jgi:hypothetical protein
VASLSATAVKDSIPTSEQSVLVRLVLKNTGRRPLAIVRSWFGSQYGIEYTPEAKDPPREHRIWSHNPVRPLTDSGEPPNFDASEYVLVAPGEDYRTEIDIAPHLRRLAPEGLMTGVYVVKFWYAYEPNSAERSTPLIREVPAAEPVRLTVGGRVRDGEGLRAAATATGGGLDPLESAWSWRGMLHLNGFDPEGNVVQFRSEKEDRSHHEAERSSDRRGRLVEDHRTDPGAGRLAGEDPSPRP